MEAKDYLNYGRHVKKDGKPANYREYIKGKKEEVAKKMKSPLERHEHESKDRFNKSLKAQRRSNKKLGLAEDFGLKGVSKIK